METRKGWVRAVVLNQGSSCPPQFLSPLEDIGNVWRFFFLSQARGKVLSAGLVSHQGSPLQPRVFVVQLLSCVRLFATPWTAAHQASLSFTISRSLLKLMSTESVMPSNHLILSLPSLAFSLSQHQGLFQWVGSSHQVATYWSFSFSISPSNEYSGLIFFRIDWFYLLTVQETLKSLLQHHSSKASILWYSAFFNSHIYTWLLEKSQFYLYGP